MLAKNSVRLFDSTRNVIEELPLEDIPGSFDEVVEERPERVIDVRAGSAGTQGTPSYHGPDGDVDRQMTEEFIYAVGQAVGGRLGKARSQILVLAAVEEYLPIFKEFCPYPAIFDRAKQYVTERGTTSPPASVILMCCQALTSGTRRLTTCSRRAPAGIVRSSTVTQVAEMVIADRRRGSCGEAKHVCGSGRPSGCAAPRSPTPEVRAARQQRTLTKVRTATNCSVELNWSWVRTVFIIS